MAKMYLAQFTVDTWAYTDWGIDTPMESHHVATTPILKLVEAPTRELARAKVTKYVESMGQMYESFCTIAYVDITEAL